MHKPHWTPERWIAVLTLGGLIFGLLAAAGYELSGPHKIVKAAQAELGEHVTEFGEHIEYHDSTEQVRDDSRQQRTKRIDGISRLLCVKTPKDTLQLAGMIDECAAVGVRK